MTDIAEKARAGAATADRPVPATRGLCVAGGSGDALARTRRMVDAMGKQGGAGVTVRLADDLAVGWVTTGGRGSDGDVKPATGSRALVHGNIFTEDGRPPAESVWELYRAGEIERIAGLNGSFCAIIADPERRRVTLVADRLGTRPLYYWSGTKGFAAATQLSALLADDRVPRRLQPSTLYQLVSYFRAFGPDTLYSDVACIQGGEHVYLETGGAAVQRTGRLSWCAPDFTQAQGAERLASALRAAIRRCLGDAERPALLLSGGIDSRLVLAAATAEGLALDCITVGAYENPEVETARACAEAAGQRFIFIETPPLALSASFDAATRDCDGLYIAPTNFYGALPRLAGAQDLILSGHGLDYTLRAMYLPRMLLKLGRSRTVFPRLRRIPNGSADTVAANQYVCAPDAAVRRLVARDRHDAWRASRIAGVEAALAGAEIDDPYDAWDGYILHNQSRHYAYSDFIAMDRFIDHRTLAFDAEVLGVYFAMPAAWRASGQIVCRALKRLSPTLAAIANANTGIAAGRPLVYQTAAVLGRAGLRKLGIASRPQPPDPTMTLGSWANGAELLRCDPELANRLKALPGDECLLDTGAFDRDGMQSLVDEHLGRRANHSKLLYQLLTLSSWFAQFGYERVAHDG